MESGPALDPHKEKNSIDVVCLNLKKKKKVRHESVFKQIQAISYLLVLYIRISVVLHENSHAGDVTTVSCALQWSPSCMILQTVYTADQKFWRLAWTALKFTMIGHMLYAGHENPNCFWSLMRTKSKIHVQYVTRKPLGAVLDYP